MYYAQSDLDNHGQEVNCQKQTKQHELVDFIRGKADVSRYNVASPARLHAFESDPVFFDRDRLKI